MRKKSKPFRLKPIKSRTDSQVPLRKQPATCRKSAADSSSNSVRSRVLTKRSCANANCRADNVMKSLRYDIKSCSTRSSHWREQLQNRFDQNERQAVDAGAATASSARPNVQLPGKAPINSRKSSSDIGFVRNE